MTLYIPIDTTTITTNLAVILQYNGSDLTKRVSWHLFCTMYNEQYQNIKYIIKKV